MGPEMVGGQLSPLNKAWRPTADNEDTAVAQDDFERTADGLANSTPSFWAVTAKRKSARDEAFALTRAVEELGGADGLSAAIEDAGSDLGDYLRPWRCHLRAGEIQSTTSRGNAGMVDLGCSGRTSLAVGTAGISET